MDYIDASHDISISIFPTGVFCEYHRGQYRDIITFYTDKGIVMFGLKIGTAQKFVQMLVDAVNKKGPAEASPEGEGNNDKVR